MYPWNYGSKKKWIFNFWINPSFEIKKKILVSCELIFEIPLSFFVVAKVWTSHFVYIIHLSPLPTEISSRGLRFHISSIQNATQFLFLKQKKKLHSISSFFNKKNSIQFSIKKKTWSNYPLLTFVTAPPLIITTPSIGFILLLNPTNDSHFNYTWFCDNVLVQNFHPSTMINALVCGF